MRYDSGQFGSFDALDNRREVMVLFMRLGHNLPEPLANRRRAKFLQGLIPHSIGALAPAPLVVQDCDPVAAYGLFMAICGVLEVPVDVAAKLLDEEVRKQDGKKVDLSRSDFALPPGYVYEKDFQKVLVVGN